MDSNHLYFLLFNIITGTVSKKEKSLLFVSGKNVFNNITQRRSNRMRLETFLPDYAMS